MTPEDLLEVPKENPLRLLSGVIHTGHWGATPDMQTDWVTSETNYPFYAALASIRKPLSVLEVGVRLGYSLISMFRGYPGILRIVGIDVQADVEDSQRKAGENIRGAGYFGDLQLPIADSKWIKALARDIHFNLIHIDGNHSSEGVQADINMAWPRLVPGGMLIADDTEYAPSVREGIEAMKPSIKNLGKNFYFQTYRGWWVAEKT